LYKISLNCILKLDWLSTFDGNPFHNAWKLHPSWPGYISPSSCVWCLTCVGIQFWHDTDICGYIIFFSLLFQVIFNVDMSVSMPYSVPISMFVIHSRDGEWSCNEPSMETAGWVLICVLCHIRKKSNPSLLATNDDVCNVQLVKVQVHSLRMVPLDWLNF
jgi:hypothetical protein